MANKDIMSTLDKIFRMEMTGVVRYMHYSFMVMGHARIPIQKWFRDNATESMDHATRIGEKITAFGGHPSMDGEKIKENNEHNIDQILKESLQHEEAGIELYKNLARLAEKAEDMALEELAREMVMTETEHVEEVRKMLRKDGK